MRASLLTILVGSPRGTMLYLLAILLAGCIPLDPEELVDATSPGGADTATPDMSSPQVSPMASSPPDSPFPSATPASSSPTPEPASPTVVQETPTPPQETPTPPQETPTPPQETPTPPQETPTLPQETPIPPQETPTPPQETPTLWPETPTPFLNTPPLETPTPPQETPVGPSPTLTVTPPPEPTPSAFDGDGDGFPVPLDCDDENPHTFPGQAYEWLGDEVDNDCDSLAEEPSSTQGEWAAGFAASDELGYRILVVDLDKDGLEDVLISAPGVDLSTNFSDAGAVYLYYGGPDLWTRLSSPDGAHATFTGLGKKDMLGSEIVAGQDLDGDHVNDIVIAAPSASSGKGAVFIYYGSPTRFSGDFDTDAAHAYLQGEVKGDSLGASLTFVPSLSLGQPADVVVGAPNYGLGNSDPKRGRVYRIRGGTAALGSIAVGDSDIFTGMADNDQFGASLAAPGDFNGDTEKDLVVGVPGADRPETGGTDGAGGVMRLSLDASGLVSHESYYGEPYAGAGSALLATLDVTGDSHPDVLVGASEYDGRKGRLYLLPGGPGHDHYLDLGAVPVIIVGASSEQGLGLPGTLAMVGDLEGDGTRELAVGLPGQGVMASDGQVFIFRLEAQAGLGLSMDITSADASILITGSNSEQLGITSASYSQGNGYSSLLVGANFADAPGSHSGAVYGFPGYPAVTLP